MVINLPLDFDHVRMTRALAANLTLVELPSVVNDFFAFGRASYFFLLDIFVLYQL